MRIYIPDEVNELAKSKDIDERLKILGAAVIYAIDKKIVLDELEDLLDPNKRRAKKMEGNKNSVAHTVSNRQAHTVSNRQAHTVSKVKNSVDQTVQTDKPTLLSPMDNGENLAESESGGFIYNNINNILLDIITGYIDNNITYPSIKYQIDKQGKEKYINSQIEEAEKLIKKIGFDTFQTILQYLPHDEFWSKNILSIAKLNKKNKEGVPYYAIIMDRIKQRTPKVVSIPTI